MRYSNLFLSILIGISLSALVVFAVEPRVFLPSQGGVGTSTAPSSGQVPIGNASSTYTPAFLTAGGNITISTSSGAITIAATSTPSFTTLWTNTLNATSATMGTISISSLATSPLIVGGSATTTIYGDGTTSVFGGGISATTGAFSATTTFPGSGIWNSLGNVGIGTTTPTGVLQVQNQLGQSPSPIIISRADSGQAWGLQLQGSDFNIRDETNNKIVFVIEDNSPVNSLYIKDTGNVGIATTTPQSILQLGTPKDATNSYFQLDVVTSAPAAGDCDAENEIGRVIMASTTARYLYVCGGVAGWGTSTISF